MRILLVQTSFPGDVVLSSPVIAGIKELHPNSELFFLGTSAGVELVRRDPLLNGFLVYDKRADGLSWRVFFQKLAEIRELRFDRVYCLHRSMRSGLLMLLSGIKERVGFQESHLALAFTERVRRTGIAHDVLRNISILSKERSLTSLPDDLRLFAPSENEIASETIRELVTAEHYIVVAPGSVWYTKMWHWSNYRVLVQQLCQRGEKVVVLGAPQERDNNRQVCSGTGALDLTGATTLSEMLAIVRSARLVVCNDSFPLHVSSAFKVPCVAIFCATSPRFGFGPWKNRSVVVERDDLRCKPCRRHGGVRCPTGTEACMRDLPPAQVLRAVDLLLGKGSAVG